MTRLDLTDLRMWDEIVSAHLPKTKQTDFVKRRDAMKCVAAGDTIKAAGKKHSVHPKILSAAITKALSVAPDGRPWGWRACIPHRVRTRHPPTSEELPRVAGPGAFGRLLVLVPKLEALLMGYAGPLPRRDQPAPAFERFFTDWKKCARDLVPAGYYPHSSPDFARRSCLEFLKSQRAGAPFIDSNFEVADANDVTQLAEVFELPATAWVQYDGHSFDCDFYLEGIDPDGKPYLQKLRKVWLLVGFAATARLVMSCHLSFASNYSGVDFNRLCGGSLRDWEPRDLLAPKMSYVSGSGIGTRTAIGFAAGACITSCDNAMAHRLRVNRQQMAEQLLGVINFGRSHVPETRGLLEAFNKRIAECAIRLLPGGYRPGSQQEPATATNKERAEDYPLVPEALRDLMDVVCSGANSTPIAAHQERSPLEFTRDYFQRGGWFFHSSDQADRARNLSREVVTVTIKGNRDRRKRKMPFVKFKYGRYRAPSLKNRWDLIGKTFVGDYDINDMRYLTLYDENGEVYVILRALRPWAQTPHDLDLRRSAHFAGRKGKFEIKGCTDAVAAFRDYQREVFCQSQEAATQLARFESTFQQIQPEPFTPAPDPGMVKATATEKLFVPLGGRVFLGKRRPL